MARTFSHTMDVRIEDSFVKVEIEFSFSPVIPATYEDPPEGGEMEIDSATLIIPPMRFEQKEPERIPAPNWLIDILTNDKNVYDTLGDACDWGADGPNPDEERQRAIDDGPQYDDGSDF